MSKKAREQAAASGKLPHEILLDMARGNPQKVKVVDAQGKVTEKLVAVTLDDMKDAAKAAASYYAPKISTVELISGMGDDDLDSVIEKLAGEAGIGLGAGGEGQEDPAAPAPRKRARLKP